MVYSIRLMLLTFLLVKCNYAFTQNDGLKWSEVVTGEDVYVASTLKANSGISNDKDRVLRVVKLPVGSVGYVFKITVTESGSGGLESLFSLLEKIPATRSAGLLGSLITKGDGNECDVFIFDDKEESRKFVNKESGWVACQLYKQTTATCRFADDCLDMIQFGFRNNNIATGVHVLFELVALVDPNAKTAIDNKVANSVYANCISNDTLKRVFTSKHQSFCNCLVEKIKYDSVLIRHNDSYILETRVNEIGQSCILELGIINESELQKQDVLNEMARLNESHNSQGLIDFCASVIKQGKEYEEVYNALGYECLLTKQFTKARYFLELAASKFPLDLYIQGNYAHSLLFTGDYDKAVMIYKRYLNENIDASISWRDATITDINKFKALGISNEHFQEIEDMMEPIKGKTDTKKNE